MGLYLTGEYVDGLDGYEGKGLTDRLFTQARATDIPQLTTKDLMDRTSRIIAKDKCSAFLDKLLSKAEEITKRPRKGTSISSVLRSVEQQRGVVYGDTIQKHYGYKGATVHGSLAMGTAAIELAYPGQFMSFQPQAAHDRVAAVYIEEMAWNSAQALIHESFHLAGYDDGDLMRAAAALENVEAPDLSKLSLKDRVTAEGNYWAPQLRTACPTPK